jgi:hypothetical protein
VFLSERMREARWQTHCWNNANPERFIPWEWVEEALIAYLRSDVLRIKRPQESAAQAARYMEYVVRIPGELRDYLEI